MLENQASTTDLLVTVARGAGPLQRQVEDQLRAAIRSGRLVEGERLPSSRLLAADLGVSRGVVSDAYMQLAAEGWLVVTPRSSPRVAPGPIKGSDPLTKRFRSEQGFLCERSVEGSDPLIRAD